MNPVLDGANILLDLHAGRGRRLGAARELHAPVELDRYAPDQPRVARSLFLDLGEAVALVLRDLREDDLGQDGEEKAEDEDDTRHDQLLDDGAVLLRVHGPAGDPINVGPDIGDENEDGHRHGPSPIADEDRRDEEEDDEEGRVVAQGEAALVAGHEKGYEGHGEKGEAGDEGGSLVVAVQEEIEGEAENAAEEDEGRYRPR